MIKRMVVAFVLLAVMIGRDRATCSGPSRPAFVPNEDQGYVLGQIVMPDAASLKRTAQTSAKVDELFAKNPAVAAPDRRQRLQPDRRQYKPNVATFFVTFKDFKERYSSTETREAGERQGGAAGRASQDRGASIRGCSSRSRRRRSPASAPRAASSSGSRTRGPAIRCGSTRSRSSFSPRRAKRPELAGLNSTFRAISQQLRADVDRSKAVLLGVPVGDVYSALQAQFGSIMVSQFKQYSRVWNVILQSDAPYRRDARTTSPGSTRRSTNGQMVPLSAVVTTEYVTGPDLVPHFNGFPAAQVTGARRAGLQLG